jgi:hypothetical protein
MCAARILSDGLIGTSVFHAANNSPESISTALAVVDPPAGIPMAGYGTRYSKGKLDPIEARVLALSDGTRTIALVTLDLCFPFDPPVMDQIRAEARASVDEIVFHASHTHSGPTYSAAP